MVFLEGSAPALPKISAHQEMRPPDFFSLNGGMLRLAPCCFTSAAKIIASRQQLPSFRRCFCDGQHRR